MFAWQRIKNKLLEFESDNSYLKSKVKCQQLIIDELQDTIERLRQDIARLEQKQRHERSPYLNPIVTWDAYVDTV